MNFGEVLQTKRKSMGLTQEDLADKLFVSSKTISNWETNKTTPDIDNVRFKDNIIIKAINIIAVKALTFCR